MTGSKGKVIAIAGPTASGKSSVAVELAQLMNADIVSADCYQCYRHMDIGTAKPDAMQLKKVKHYMIDKYEPSQNISVSEYTKAARHYIDDIIKGKNVIVTGGSGLYLDSIIFSDYEYKKLTVDEKYRSELDMLASTRGNDYLYALLVECDPDYALITHKNNVKRVIRALEYFHSSGEKMSAKKRCANNFHYANSYYFALKLDRNILYERINKRVDLMVENGLLDEVNELLSRYDVSDSHAFKAIGYSEFISCIKECGDIAEAIELIKQHSRNYAKRQMTWFNRNKLIQWISIENDDAEKTAKQIAEICNV